MSQSTPETDAKRIRGFELYCTAGLDGRRRSVRSISQELGVALSTAQYWHKTDGWDLKLQKVLKETAHTAASVTEAIRARLRKGILEGLSKANDIIKDDKTKDRDKILALRELTNIAIRLQALDLGGAAADSGSLEFQDDLPTNGTDLPSAPEPGPESASGNPG